MPIDQELLTFAATRKSWQRDSLRRICTQSDLTAADIQEIFANLKATEGLCQTGTQTDANGIGIGIRAQQACTSETYIRIRIPRAAGPGFLTCRKKTFWKVRN